MIVCLQIIYCKNVIFKENLWEMIKQLQKSLHKIQDKNTFGGLKMYQHVYVDYKYILAI